MRSLFPVVASDVMSAAVERLSPAPVPCSAPSVPSVPRAGRRRWLPPVGPAWGLLGVLAGLVGCAEPPQNTSPYVPIDQRGPPPGGPSSGAERAMDAGQADGGGGPGGADRPPDGGAGDGGGPPGSDGPGGDVPGAAGGDALGGCRLTPSWEGKSDGSGATLSGRAAGEGTGQLLVDIVDAESSQVVWGVECPGTGNFTAVLPSTLGTVWVAAYLDLTGDGPTSDDPQGRSAGSFSGSAPPDDLEIDLVTGSPVTGVRESGGGPPPDGGGGGEAAPPEERTSGDCRVVGEGEKPGSGAKVTVALSAPDGAAGSLLVDVVKAETNEVAHSLECGFQRSLALQVPAELGKVYLAVYLDSGADGPTEDDPQGRNQHAFGSQGGQASIQIDLKTGAPLRDLARAGEDEEAPPAGAGDAGGPPPGEPDPGGPPPGEGAAAGDGPPTDAPPADAP